MFGLNWLYRKARQFKKLAFFVSGVGVAISTATVKATPVVSWIANLIAVTAAGFYSIFKNTETAAAITGSQQEIDTTKTALTLDHYRDQPISLPEVLTQATVFTDEEKGKIQISVLRDFTVESSSYVNWNLVLQGVLGVVAVVINTFANVESDSKSDTPVYYLNLTIVPICILSQYLIHMGYTADNLRTIATDVTALQTKLSTVRHGLLFRALERKDYISFKGRLVKELEDISRLLAMQEERKQKMHVNFEQMKQQSITINEEISIKREKFGDFDINKYLSIEINETILREQLIIELQNAQRNDITVQFCLDYIHDTQRYQQLEKDIAQLDREIQGLVEDVQGCERRKEMLETRYKTLVDQEPKIEQVELELQKLVQINRA